VEVRFRIEHASDMSIRLVFAFHTEFKIVSSDTWRSLEFFTPPTPPPPGGASRSMWRSGRRAPRVRPAEPGDRGETFRRSVCGYSSLLGIIRNYAFFFRSFVRFGLPAVTVSVAALADDWIFFCLLASIYFCSFSGKPLFFAALLLALVNDFAANGVLIENPYFFLYSFCPIP